MPLCAAMIGLSLWSLASPGNRLWSQGGEDLPGEPARIAYEMGFAYLLAHDTERARRYLETAVGAGGVYGDLARIELVRLLATNRADPNTAAAVLPSIRQVLLGFEDRTRIPRAWYAAVQALEDAGRYEPSLEMAMELALRYPESIEADDALFAAARLHHANGNEAAALENLFRILKEYSQGDRVPVAYLMIARIYSTPGEYYSPGRACAALEVVRSTPSATHTAARQLYRDFCVY